MPACVWLFVTLWTEAHWAPLSMGFYRWEYESGLPFPSPGDLPKPGIEPATPESPALAGRLLTTEPRGKPLFIYRTILNIFRVRASEQRASISLRMVWNPVASPILSPYLQEDALGIPELASISRSFALSFLICSWAISSLFSALLSPTLFPFIPWARPLIWGSLQELLPPFLSAWKGITHSSRIQIQLLTSFLWWVDSDSTDSDHNVVVLHPSSSSR